MITSFRTFITERKETNKVTHLQHIEDLVFVDGYSGLTTSINLLRDVANHLTGNKTNQDIKISTKYDSAPSIVFGLNPENNKFFVGTKSVFNTREPKINYTEDDIDKNHIEKGLNEKLKYALKYLPELNPKYVYQAELMYIDKDIKELTINDIDYITFKTNIIIYGVPKDIPLANKITNSKLGVIVHTQYVGNTILELVATNNNIEGLSSNSKNVWYSNADFEIKDNKIKLNDREKKFIHEKIKILQDLVKTIDSNFVEELVTKPLIFKNIHKFNNSLVRFKEKKTPLERSVELINYIKYSFDDDILLLKTDKGKDKKREDALFYINYLTHNKEQLIKLYEFQDLIVELKLFLLERIKNIRIFDTFVELQKDDYKSIKPEGLVIMSSEGSVKLVDRMVFSYLNFNIQKDWNREEIK